MKIRVGFIPALKGGAFSLILRNNLLYAARHLAETTARDFRAGFVHVPFSHAQAAVRDEGEPSMAIETMETGIVTGLETALRTLDDPDVSTDAVPGVNPEE